MWYEVEITSTITAAIEANCKEEAESKAQDAIWFDSDIVNAVMENAEVGKCSELEDEDDADMCTIKLED